MCFVHIYINCESEIVNIIVFAGVTILLSQTVFRLLVGHVIIKTSDAVPILGRLYYDSQPCCHSRQNENHLLNIKYPK